MIERKLRINLSGLWENTEELFTIRFQNLNETDRKILAKRIKALAPQWKIRRTNGPTPEVIYEALLEINPIIFTECISNYRPEQYRRFNINCTKTINGYYFKALCKGIYILTCLKRTQTRNDINHIALLTHQNWNKVDEYIDQHWGQEIETQERIQPITDIGILDIENARRRAEDNGANRIPAEMFDNSIQEQTENFQETHPASQTQIRNRTTQINEREFRMMYGPATIPTLQPETRRISNIERIIRRMTPETEFDEENENFESNEDEEETEEMREIHIGIDRTLRDLPLNSNS